MGIDKSKFLRKWNKANTDRESHLLLFTINQVVPQPSHLEVAMVETMTDSVTRRMPVLLENQQYPKKKRRKKPLRFSLLVRKNSKPLLVELDSQSLEKHLWRFVHLQAVLAALLSEQYAYE